MATEVTILQLPTAEVIQEAEAGAVEAKNGAVQAKADALAAKVAAEEAAAAVPTEASITSQIEAEAVPRWKPLTDYLAGARALTPYGAVETAVENHTSTNSYGNDVAKWRTGTPIGVIPVVKPEGDQRPGVWEYTHNSNFGYLYHLLAGPKMLAPAAIIALGVDNGTGSGLLVVNKAEGSNGIALSQRSTVKTKAAFIGTQEATTITAPLVSLSTNVAGAADLLQLLVFGAPTSGQRAFYFGDANGQAGAIMAADGRLEWRRPVRIMARGGNDNTVDVTENESYAFGDPSARMARLSKKGITMYSPSGGGTLWPYALIADGSGMNIFTGPAGAFGATPANSVLAVKNNQIGFLGASAISRRAATADATDLASALALVNALKADLIAFGLKAAA
jgi:hypothetical protein